MFPNLPASHYTLFDLTYFVPFCRRRIATLRQFRRSNHHLQRQFYPKMTAMPPLSRRQRRRGAAGGGGPAEAVRVVGIRGQQFTRPTRRATTVPPRPQPSLTRRRPRENRPLRGRRRSASSNSIRRLLRPAAPMLPPLLRLRVFRRAPFTMIPSSTTTLAACRK